MKEGRATRSRARAGAYPDGMTAAESLRLIRAHVASGRLAALADEFGLDLVVLHGSARRSPEEAHDVDLAYLPAPGVDVDPVAVEEAFSALVPGDDLDLMPLHRADPVAAYAALGRGEMLVERESGMFAERRIRAFGEYRDTQKFRDLALSLVGT